MIRRMGVIGLAVAAFALAGCGERPQVIQYKQGTYQGKPDQKPYAGAPFDGNQQKWDNDLRQRKKGGAKERSAPVKGKTRGKAATAKSGASVAAKYRGPNGETWSGRGLMPRWLSALVAQGQAKDSFLIQP